MDSKVAGFHAEDTVNLEGYQGYRDVSLKARAAQASPVELVLMLTDGLLEELARARAHIEGRRYELKAKSLKRCIDILHGLNGALDHASGGELVMNLSRLYDFCARQLYVAGFKLDVKAIDQVTQLTLTLRRGWQGYQDRHG